MNVITLIRLRLDQSLAIACMKPSEFCQRYVKLKSGEWGYRTACTKELAQATNTPERTVDNWWNTETQSHDDCPGHILTILQKEDALRRIAEIANRYNEM